MIFRSFQTGLLFLLFSGLFAVASETNEKQIEAKRSGYWTYYCKNYEKERQCEIARKINIEEHNETFLIIYKITKDINSKKKENLNIFTPSSSKVNTEKRLNISFVTKKKIGNAVRRNKIKRRLRNIMNEAVKNISINFMLSFTV